MFDIGLNRFLILIDNRINSSFSRKKKSSNNIIGVVVGGAGCYR